MKAILIVDMPKSCGQCPCVSFKINKFECQWRYIDNPDIVQDWCPLKPLPKSIVWFENGNVDWQMFATGWNACLERLEK